MPIRQRWVRWIGAHRPLVFVVVLLVLSQMWRAGNNVADETGQASWLNWVVVGVAVYACVVVLLVVPRSAVAMALLLGLVSSLTPFVTAFACYLAGADSWVMPLGFVVAVVLLAGTMLWAPSPEAR